MSAAGLSPRRPGFKTQPVRLVVDQVSLGKISLRVLPFSSVTSIPPMLRTHFLIYCRPYIDLAADVVTHNTEDVLLFLVHSHQLHNPSTSIEYVNESQ